MSALRQRIAAALDRSSTVWVACAISLALGLFFLLVWSPLPWGWLGIDFYNDRAVRLASGLPFDTTDVPWGYAYFVAAFYVIFGSHPVIPLFAQVALNALVPLLLYRLVQPLMGQRVAALAALMAGVFSFNTVYASTQSSDCVSTVLFLVSLLLFSRGHLVGRTLLFAGAGLVAGVVPQFRPNLILFPPILAAVYTVRRRFERRALASMTVYLAVAGLALSPWIVRNYRLTHLFMPTSTHGGVQLWYGTLQVGPYLESRADNPRSAFEASAFKYTSLANLPLVVSAPRPTCGSARAAKFGLVYWTDRDHTPHRATSVDGPDQVSTFTLPGQPDPTAIYYFYEARQSPESPASWTPAGGPERPFVYFVSSDHLGDMDRHDDLLDIFDLIRLLRSVAWSEPPASVAALDMNSDGRISEEDVRIATRLLAAAAGLKRGEAFQAMRTTNAIVTLSLTDGSTLAVPQAWTGRVTDITVRGPLATALVYVHRPLADRAGVVTSAGGCLPVETGSLNDAFYRWEPHIMQRYLALAMDNIGRDPWAYVASAGYRMIRLFVIRGSSQIQEAQQFGSSRAIYLAGTVLSGSYLLLCIAGAVVAWRRKYNLLPVLLPIVYVPVTIGWVLTNMRYTITVQPLMFVFVAVVMITALRLDSSSDDERTRLRQESSHRAQ
jgi:hypothetical protein